MNTRSKVFYSALLAVLIMAASPFGATAAPYGQRGAGCQYGAGMYGPGMYGGWAQNAPQEKRELMVKLHQEHQEKMQSIQEQIWTKQTTLDALSGNPKVDPKDLTALISELSTLRSQAMAERKNFTAKVKAETGFEAPYGGPGMGGYGYGHHNGKRGGGRHNNGYRCGW